MTTMTDGSFASFTSDDDEDFEITFNSPLKRQLIHATPVGKSCLQDENAESNTNNNNNTTTTITAPTIITPPSLEPEKEETEEEKLKREIQEETERLRQERMKEDEERRKRARLKHTKQGAIVAKKPEVRDESELSEKQLLARKKREEQRQEMMKRRQAMLAQKKQQQTESPIAVVGAASVFDPAPQELAISLPKPEEAPLQAPSSPAPFPAPKEDLSLPASPAPSPVPKEELSLPASPLPSSLELSPIKAPIQVEKSPVKSTIDMPALELSPIKAPLPAPSAPQTEKPKTEDEGFSLSSLGLPSLTEMNETEEAENESLLKMELMFLQKKYDKEVKARMQLQKALIEYKKTIENLVGQKRNNSEMEEKLKNAQDRSAEAEKQLRLLKKEMEAIAKKEQEKDEQIRSLQEEVTRLSGNLQSGEEKKKELELARQEGRKEAEKELHVWKSKCEHLEGQVEVYKRISDIKEKENIELTRICDELLSHLK